MLKNSSGFSHILLLLVAVVLTSLLIGMGANVPKQSTSTIPSVPQNVLGEKSLAPCSGGGLTTAIYKDFQMQYKDESFLRIVNSKDLLKDVSQLKDLTCLQYLDATDQTIKGDISNLKNLVNLEVFSLYSNPEITGDICALKDATKLRSLKFAFDPKVTGDISCLKNLTSLETFAMTHTNISGDISVFANMPNLKAIYVSGTYFKGDICSLSKLTNLEELGIADEYPGNPDITGDLGCLDNLKKLKRVSIYNTSTTNCQAFTKSHPDLAKTKTESGKQGGGGCSKESMKTLVDYAQKYEKKIGKEVQTEVRGKPNYGKQMSGNSENPQGGQENISFFEKIIRFFRHLIGQDKGFDNQGPAQTENPNEVRSQAGPGGCKSQSECDAFCDKPENRSECSKFSKNGPGGNSGQDQEPKVSPGGCKSDTECQNYCSKPEHREECSKFAPREKQRGSEQ